MTQADCNISTHPEKSVAQAGKPTAPSNIAADPIGAVLILSGPPGETGTAPAILLRSDGTAAALHAIPGADGVWSLSEPIEQLTPQKVRDCFLGMKAIRKEATQEIERLIALLDRLDPDPDLEENGDRDADLSEDEPSLGSVDNRSNQEKWSAGGINSEPDLEGEHDGREPDDEPEDGGDDEPSLGAREPSLPDPRQGYYWGSKLCFPNAEDRAAVYDQTSWFGYDSSDREDEHDGREPDADGEEDDPGEDADNGIGDAGGLAEQTGGAL